MKIDGKVICNNLGEKFKNEIDPENKPSLAIVYVGQNSASESFINVKKKFGEKYGFNVYVAHFDEQIELEDLKKHIRSLQIFNNSIIVQLPLPDKFKENIDEILQEISPEKDVDNLTNKSEFVSPIILSLNFVLNNEDLAGKIGIIGMGKVVGEPIFNYLENKKLNTLSILEGELSNAKDCDVLISAVGIPKFIRKENIKEGAVLIDYGCAYLNNKLCGDFDEECFEIAKKYTPVPGGMGPIVVACLFTNVLESFSK